VHHLKGFINRFKKSVALTEAMKAVSKDEIVFGRDVTLPDIFVVSEQGPRLAYCIYIQCQGAKLEGYLLPNITSKKVFQILWVNLLNDCHMHR
jgi:hypothetical protein